ncbi:MAG: KUP/HAK/KT family potassium transporter [Bacteroidales bacterium]|nr:KUP/HAK/KT family potassium transporter [Bacteroidales bacterium]
MGIKSDNISLGKVTLAGLVITLGVVYGDIGTSPLYVMKAIIDSASGDKMLIAYGALSCIFWTLTLQTTIKYVIITLRADNHGEGGIFALFALLKNKSTIAVIVTMIGGCALLADGIITPSITVTSSIEGLHLITPQLPVVPLVLIILTALFFVQQFGTNFIGKSFGPIMVIWFVMIGTLGISQILRYPSILAAVSPVYAYQFLSSHPHGYLILGAVFLCTTGAEALYSDLGHCGLKNIRITWIFVKTTLLLNYFGQGAWYLLTRSEEAGINPFYGIMPEWFLLPGIIIAAMAAIIASQAMISGSFTLISEAVSLNFWPKIRISQPTVVKGQVYISSVNWFLWIACCFVVILFKESSRMGAAYGLSITITMIITTFLLAYYWYQRKVPIYLIMLLVGVYFTLQGTFLIANLNKFMHGGWFTIVTGLLFFLIMYGWYYGRKIKNKYIKFVNLYEYIPLIQEISRDATIPKFASNLVYIVKANRLEQIENKIIYSIINKQPKRADTYWFIHVDILDNPDTFEYKVHHIIPGILIKVDFRLGFKIERRINLYFREVLEDLVKSGEINLTSRYKSLSHFNIMGDFVFVNLDRIMSPDYKLTPWETVTMGLHEITRWISINDVKALGLDTSNVIEEKVPISIEQIVTQRIKRKK